MVDMKSEFELEIKRKYDTIIPEYKRLGHALKTSMELLLKTADIDYITIESRVKKFKSFFDKIQRKNYKDPLNETEDICGIRIITLYHSGLEKISELIRREFTVLSAEDKSDIIDPDKFGYRSWHFVIKIKEEWLKTPQYRNLGGLKIEIQIRTNLMHTWAAVEHKLAYKKEGHVPREIKRKFSRLSALFELADEQLDYLRNDKELYVSSLITESVMETGVFNSDIELNFDSLQSLLDHYFPERIKTPKNTSELLDELNYFNFSMKELVDVLEKAKGILQDVEKDQGKLLGKPLHWAQVGAVRMYLDILNDKYWEDRQNTVGFPSKHIDFIKNYRERISQNR